MARTGLMERAVAWTSRRLMERIPHSSANPYLEGRFAPVPSETTETALEVTGSIPRELEGLYARIGPNPASVRNPGAYHWFLGDGMVHGVRLAGGRAQWYRNRWVGTDSVNARMGRAPVPGPRHGPFDTVNTNVIGHAGRIWALVEAGPVPMELDGDLGTVGHRLFDSPRVEAYTAHPHRDPATGELHAICYDALRPFRVQHIVVDAQGAVTRVQPIPVKHGPMIHDCALTASSVVVLDLPITFSLPEMLRGYPFPYRWNPKHDARVGLLPRNGTASDIRWFDVDPCYVFHPCNAYDLPDGGAVVDVVVHERLFHSSHQGPEPGRITFERWTLDTASRRVKRQVLSDARQEFPRFDERRTGQAYRYAYTTAFDLDTTAKPLFRYDLPSGTQATHDFGPGRVAGEAVFVPRSAESAEDDGWLITYVYDLDRERSDLVVLNAGDFEGEPQATVHLPGRVPMGFHGNWIPDA